MQSLSDYIPQGGNYRIVNFTHLKRKFLHIFSTQQWQSITCSKVWLTVKIRGTRVPQNAIVPGGRPYSIIILNMRFIPKASLRASSQITASSYIIERHLWVNNSIESQSSWSWILAGHWPDCTNWLYYCGYLETGWPDACTYRRTFSQTLYISPMLA